MGKKKKNKKKNVGKIDRFNIVFVDIQVIITVMTLILAVMFILGKTSLKMFQLSLGLNLLMIAFNNYTIYKRSKLTILYAIVGVIILICLVV